VYFVVRALVPFGFPFLLHLPKPVIDPTQREKDAQHTDRPKKITERLPGHGTV